MIPAASHTVQTRELAGELILIGEMNNVKEELYLISSYRKIANPIAAELMKTFTLKKKTTPQQSIYLNESNDTHYPFSQNLINH